MNEYIPNPNSPLTRGVSFLFEFPIDPVTFSRSGIPLQLSFISIVNSSWVLPLKRTSMIISFQ